MRDHAVDGLNHHDRDVQCDGECEGTAVARDGCVGVAVAGMAVGAMTVAGVATVAMATVALPAVVVDAVAVGMVGIVAVGVAVGVGGAVAMGVVGVVVVVVGVVVLALFGGRVRGGDFLHDGSRGYSPAGSATCSSMPASIALM